MLLALRVKTQYTMDDQELTPIIARRLILPYLTPALVYVSSFPSGIRTFDANSNCMNGLTELLIVKA